MISTTFRFQLALMLMRQRVGDAVVSCYGYGDHVSDPLSFRLRCRNVWAYRPERKEDRDGDSDG